MEVWRWVEAGEHQLGGWRYGGGVVEAASDTPTWHGAGGGWWLGGGAGHGPRPSPRVAHLHTSPPLVAAGHCSLSRHLVTSVLTAPLRPRSHQALLRLRLAEVCCWCRGREDEAALGGWRDAAPAASRPAAATVHCTLYCTLYSWPGRCTPEVGCQTPAGGWWWLECPDNVITTLSLLPAHIFSTLLP